MNLVKFVDRRNTNCLKYDDPEMTAISSDIIPLWIADMDFAAPDSVLTALRELNEQGAYGYSAPGSAYYDAVQNWFERRYHWRPEKEWIALTSGVVSALCTCVRTYTEVGDAVMILTPVYNHFFPPIEDNHRRVVYSELVLENGAYQIDFDDVARVMDTEKPKMFIMCSPQNPIGRVWTKEELTRLGEMCFARGIQVVADEIHCDFIYPGHTFYPFLSLGKEFEQKAIACTAPSKTFNLAGLGASNIIIPDPEKRAAFQRERLEEGSDMLPTPGLVACRAAYEGGEEWLEELLVYLKGNADAVNAFLAENLPEIRTLPLEGTYLMWVDCRNIGIPADELYDFMLKKAKVRFGEGSSYGKGGEGFLRLNLATSRELILTALQRVKDALDAR